MTAIYIHPVGYPHFCRLLTVGTSRHVTACRASIPADEPVIITAAEPAQSETCSACWHDTQAKQQRDADLMPYAVELGNPADISVPRTITPNLRSGADTVDLLREWDGP